MLAIDILKWPGVSVPFLTSFFLAIALTLAVIPYGKRRPVGKPLTWGEAMIGSVYALMQSKSTVVMPTLIESAVTPVPRVFTTAWVPLPGVVLEGDFAVLPPEPQALSTSAASATPAEQASMLDRVRQHIFMPTKNWRPAAGVTPEAQADFERLHAKGKHGWVPKDMPVYNPDAAERHWTELTALFDDVLK